MDAKKPEAPRTHQPAARVARLFEKYFGDPQSPRLEEIERLAEEMLLRNAELDNNVGNLRKMVHQLEAYRDRYVDLYELAPVGYVTLDEEGYVQEINLAGAELLGISRDALIGYPLENHVRPEERENFKDQVRKCCCEHQVLTFEVELTSGDGRSITAHLRGVPLDSLQGDITLCKIAITDITDRKRAEETLRASEANYRTVFDTANDAIFVHDIDTGIILDTNAKATELYGYTAEEFRNASVDAFSDGHPPYSQQEALHWIGLAAAGTPQLFTWRARNKAGKIFWTEVNLKRTALNGTPRLLAIVRDITERKQNEEALQASEERFRTLADYTYDWEYWRGVDGNFRYVSPSCQRVTGYTPAEFLADPALLERIVHPDDRNQLTTHFRGESPNPAPHTAEYRIISRAGEVRWIEHICQPVYGVDQRWLGQRASNRDITDRKNAELELRRQMEELEKRLALQNDGVAR